MASRGLSWTAALAEEEEEEEEEECMSAQT
jgi:hypothetical protein